MTPQTLTRFCLLCALAAVGCAKTVRLATSEAPSAPSTPAPAEEKTPSVIAATSPNDAIFGSPILGDIDGDGLDDFLLQTSFKQPDGFMLTTSRVYLFYGRPSFATSLSAKDADAVFQAQDFSAAALGDINGDGFADFAIGGAERGFTLVFGQRERYAGEYAYDAVGIQWRTGDGDNLSSIQPAGDVNGDGCADLLFHAWSAGDDFEEHQYLVLGHEGEWSSETWNPSRAVAELGADSVMLFPDSNGNVPVYKLRAYAAGDIDGDGYADLFAKAAFGVFVFYGGPDAFEGTLGADRASAQLPPGFGNNTYGIRDFDGDGIDDLVVGAGPQLNIVYGSARRLSGEYTAESLQPDLVVKAPADDPSISLLMSATGDIDGDGAPELIIAARTFVAPLDRDTAASTKLLYTVRGQGSRLTGVVQLTAAEVRTLGTEGNAGVVEMSDTAPPWGSAQTTFLSLAGDIDGDGSCDIITEGATSSAMAQPGATVTFIPSTPRAPD